MPKELVFFPPQTPDRHLYTRRIQGAFEAYLARNGLRLTGQRRRILDYFLKSDRHLSQEEIFGALRGHGLGRATVFRTLRMLEECGLIGQVTGKDGAPRFEVNFERPHHEHLICTRCGWIQEVRWPRLERIQDDTCRRVGFRPRWHRHEIFGLCRDCSKKEA